MSASEKLKALDMAMTRGPWPGTIVDANGNLQRLRDALPQIVAAVEALEIAVHPSHNTAKWRKEPGVEALTALDEALS